MSSLAGLAGSGVTANACIPGVVATGLLADYMGVPRPGGASGRPWGRPDQGAEPIVYLAASPEVAGVTGRYFVGPRARRRSSPASYDEELQRRLWEESARLVSLADATAP